MRKPAILVAFVWLLLFPLTALPQSADSVDVTFFHYPTGSPSVVYLPGEFNGWQLNNTSRMSYDADAGVWWKTVRLRVGGPNPLPAPGLSIPGAYQYKFNEGGNVWLSDPRNPRQNPPDNNNSYLYIQNPTIHYLLPNSVSGAVRTDRPEISAYIFPTISDSVDASSIRLVIDDTEYTGLAGNYDESTNIFSFTPPAPLANGTRSLKLFVRSSSARAAADSTTFLVVSAPNVVIAERPAGIADGINYLDDDTVVLSLFAPRKEFVYVIGDFNDWQVAPDYLMKLTPDSLRFWLEIGGLEAGREYRFQYLIDGELRIADPYTHKISDPWNDRFISATTYPGLQPYPEGKTQEIAATLQIGMPPYEWEVENFQRPAPEDLVIYELLVRDFIARHDYKTLIDTLDYLDRLGINAIELMPVNEFEGNESWGYNPSFYFAVDKYYGPADDLKRFIDACHKRGIAVILDMVLNHSFGQSPFVRLYSQGLYGPPTADNPWYNVTATHPFSVGYDFNHESAVTKTLVDSVNAFWLREFRVDGFRFDLSKGFTQRQSGSNVGFWSQYDASRIALLKRMADHIWSVDSTAYVILEHFAENREEKELAEYRNGMLLWGNMNTAYSQSAMGWLEDGARSSDLAWGYYKTRGWNKARLITYMESHDEQWLMYRNLQFGRGGIDYNVRDLSTALDRIKLVAAFFFTIPGPKMMWQFGELGYDQNLPESGGGRTAPKPILWNYYRNPERLSLYKTFAALIKLRNDHEVFRSVDTQVNWRVGQGQYDRRINLSHPTMNVTIIGNFGVTPRQVNPNFQSTGRWYNFFLGDSIEVTSPTEPFTLAPGEFHIFTSVRVESPEAGITTSIDDEPVAVAREFALQPNYPNPFNPETTIPFSLAQAGAVQLKVFDLLGREVATLVDGPLPAGSHIARWDGRDRDGVAVSSGVYLVKLTAGAEVATRKIALLK